MANKSERARRARQKRRKARQKQYNKTHKNLKQESAKVENGGGFGNKVFKFIDEVVSVFIPSRSRIAHDRLIKQGVMLGVCVIALVSGGIISYRAQAKKDYIASQIQSFATTQLQFSKTGTSVSTKNKPFKTDNSKTVYVPLYIKDTSSIPTNAAKYHMLIAPATGKQLNYSILKAQLISYGSTGHYVLAITSSQKITSQMVQIVIWSSDKLTNDTYEPDENGDASGIIEQLKKRFDTLDFTINLGGSSIKPISEYDTYKQKQKVVVLDKKTNKKRVETKVVTHKKLNPDNKYLYNDRDYLAFIYNRIATQKYVDGRKKAAEKTYNNLDIYINKLKDDHDKLITSGYDVPDIPNWAATKANNMKNGLPYLYEDIQKTDYMQPFTSSKKQETVFSTVLAEYQRTQDVQTSTSTRMQNKYSDDSSITNYIQKMQDKTIKNRKLNKSIGIGSGDNSSVAASQWSDYLNNLQNIYDAKTKLYYTIPLHLYEHYQIFLDDASWGSSDNEKLNSGAITMSNTSGSDKSGKYVIILGNPINSK